MKDLNLDVDKLRMKSENSDWNPIKSITLDQFKQIPGVSNTAVFNDSEKGTNYMTFFLDGVKCSIPGSRKEIKGTIMVSLFPDRENPDETQWVVHGTGTPKEGVTQIG